MKLLIFILIFSTACEGQVIRANPFYKAKTSVACSYLLDQYSGDTLACSLRKLDCDYAGSAIRVRRSSDNTEQDIGFTSAGDLDTATLKTFVGAGDGLIAKFYDQKGRTNFLYNTTSNDQPSIMLGGVVNRENGLPIIVFDGTNDYLISTFTLPQPLHLFLSGKIPTTSTAANYHYVFSSRQIGGGSSGPAILYSYPPTPNSLSYAGAIIGDNTIRTGLTITSALYNGASSDFYHNNTSIASGNAGTLGFQFMVLGKDESNGSFQNTKVFECILFSSSKSSDRSAITSNINSYYSIY